MSIRINFGALLKPLVLVLLYYSLAGYALFYTCAQYLSLNSATHQVRDNDDAAEAICREQVLCDAEAPKREK